MRREKLRRGRGDFCEEKRKASFSPILFLCFFFFAPSFSLFFDNHQIPWMAARRGEFL